MRVGWIIDRPGYIGGAELTAKAFYDLAPADIQIVDCPPGVISSEVDVYVVHNCTQYADGLIGYLREKPTLKYVHDMWPSGDPALRDWLLRWAYLVFVSRPQMERYELRARGTDLMHDNTIFLIPPPINYLAFKGTARVSREKRPALYLGAIKLGKGIHLALEWAEKVHLPIDFYGRVHEPRAYKLIHEHSGASYCGEVDYERVPSLLNSYTTLVHLPLEFEPFGRVVAEAWASGMRLQTNDLVGFTFWTSRENLKISLQTAATDFWSLVKGLAR